MRSVVITKVPSPGESGITALPLLTETARVRACLGAQAPYL